MPTSAFTKVNQFIEDLFHGAHNFSSHQLKLALSNTAPVGTETVLANVTEVAYTNLSGGTTSLNVTTLTSEGSDGSYILDLQDMTLTASGGALPTFRYVWLYNDSQSSPLKPLIGYADYGAGGVTLADGESLDVNFDNASGAITGT